MKSDKLSILVTGGAGFIGSHLCESLIELGYRVVCLDDLNPFYSPAVKKHNLAAIQHHHDFKFIQGDVRNASYLDRCFKHHPIDAVIHLAAMAGVRPSLKDPEHYADVNIMGTLEVLRACQRHEIQRLIFASSSSVYGSKTEGAFKESDNLNSPASPYAASKKAAEILCELWQSILGIPVLSLRFFTVYGPRQRPDLAIHKFTRLLLEGKPLPVYGDGSTGRDYTYIDDIVDGILKALHLTDSFKGYDVLNLGNSHPIKLMEMLQTLEKATGKEAVIDWQPFQQGDVPYTCADITKSREILGYNPSTSFEDGISKFVEWYKANN